MTAGPSLAPRIVTPDEAALRLDRFLRRHHAGLTQGAIQKLCRTGQIRIDGKRCDPATRLEAGQAVRIPPFAVEATPEGKPRPAPKVDEATLRDLLDRILYRDDDVLVIDKPSGLATQGGSGVLIHLDGMLDGLRFGAEERPRLVHRLDRDTSGVLVLARNAFAAGKLAASFRGRETEKVYWAIVCGVPAPPEGRIDLPLVRLPGATGARTRPAEKGEKDVARAITEFVTKDRAGRKFAWLELMPVTGRTHQLRVHCAALGTPILGEPVYAGNVPHPSGFDERLHLHARRLVVPHPRGGRIEVEAELPAHMRASFERLGFAAPRAKPAKRFTG